MPFKDIFNLFNGKKQVVLEHQVDPESVKRDEEIQMIKDSHAEVLANLQKANKKIKEFEESKKFQKEDQTIIADLLSQKNQITKDNLGQGFSLRAFFKKLEKDQKFKPKICTHDRSFVLDSIKDIVVSPERITLVGEKSPVLLMGQTFDQIFQSVGALGNDCQSKMIPINLDEEGGYVENLMVWKPARAYKNSDGKIEYTSAKKEPFYKVLQEKEEEIDQLTDEIKERDETIIQQASLLRDYESTKELAVKNYEIAMNDKTKAVEYATDIQRIYNNTRNELLKFQNAYVVSEDEIRRLEAVNERLLNLAEREDSKTEFMSTLAKMKSLLSTMKTQVPQLEEKN